MRITPKAASMLCSFQQTIMSNIDLAESADGPLPPEVVLYLRLAKQAVRQSTDYINAHVVPYGDNPAISQTGST